MPSEIKHSEIPGGNLIHQPFKYAQDTDPALDVGNTVAADDWWFDLTTLHLKQRNDANDGWLTI
jgi:hypothetical protein